MDSDATMSCSRLFVKGRYLGTKEYDRNMNQIIWLRGYHDETKHNNASLSPIYLGQPTLQNNQAVDIPLHPHPTTSFLQNQPSPSPVTLHQPTWTRDP